MSDNLNFYYDSSNFLSDKLNFFSYFLSDNLQPSKNVSDNYNVKHINYGVGHKKKLFKFHVPLQGF